MSNDNYIKMLRESLGKKISLLDVLVGLNRQQEQILINPDSSPDELDKNLSEKDDIISQLNSLDEGFEALFGRVEKELNANKEHYSDDIRAMKEMITEITDKSARIRRQEKDNYALAAKKFSSIRDSVQKIRQSQKVVSKYYQSMGRMTNYEPQFLDDKQ
ncbi:MAG: flagellar export chaperone FlgN [Lachnospiraceae bacterium]|nr:flagellar export chaperone FlgN [Lachnospiraceae bacterium]